ncbi:MAG: glycosyltransferase [Eubacteriales bacterium]|nr:glycosyltransferase [Eubacteriales bacterium]
MGQKILMALNRFDIGGAETHVVELSKELQRRGYEVILASSGGAYVAELEALHMRHVTVPLDERSFIKMYRSKRLLKKLIEQERPQLVHAHARIPGFLCGLLQRKMKFPFVTTAHWVFYTDTLLRMLTNWGQYTIAVSEDIKTYLMESYHVPESQIVVTVNGIDTEKFSPDIAKESMVRELGLDASAPIIGTVSRLDDSRALCTRRMIAVAPKLAAAFPGLQMLIVGSGDVFDELKAAAEEVNRTIGRRCIVMTGARTDINRLVAVCDVFLGVSRAALEAMAEEKPVILAGNEGYIGIFSEQTLDTARESNLCCRGCPSLEEDALIRDVTDLLQASPEERAALGRYGRELVLKEYSVKRMADDCERAYQMAWKQKK